MKSKREREWRRKCVAMQNELNENNWKRYGWYKGIDGNLCFDLSVYRKTRDGFVYRAN